MTTIGTFDIFWKVTITGNTVKILMCVWWHVGGGAL